MFEGAVHIKVVRRPHLRYFAPNPNFGIPHAFTGLYTGLFELRDKCRIGPAHQTIATVDSNEVHAVGQQQGCCSRGVVVAERIEKGLHGGEHRLFFGGILLFGRLRHGCAAQQYQKQDSHAAK